MISLYTVYNSSVEKIEFWRLDPFTAFDLKLLFNIFPPQYPEHSDAFVLLLQRETPATTELLALQIWAVIQRRLNHHL